MLTISASPYRATLADTPAGVEVNIYERCTRGAVHIVPYKTIHRDIIDAPFHVVCDRTHDMLMGLQRRAP